MREPPLYTPMYVRWVDSHSSPGWKNEGEALKSAADGVVCASTGFYGGMRGEGEQRGLVLIQSRVIKGCKDVDAVLVIPLCALTAVYVLGRTHEEKQ